MINSMTCYQDFLRLDESKRDQRLLSMSEDTYHTDEHNDKKNTAVVERMNSSIYCHLNHAQWQPVSFHAFSSHRTTITSILLEHLLRIEKYSLHCTSW